MWGVLEFLCFDVIVQLGRGVMEVLMFLCFPAAGRVCGELWSFYVLMFSCSVTFVGRVAVALLIGKPATPREHSSLVIIGAESGSPGTTLVDVAFVYGKR